MLRKEGDTVKAGQAALITEAMKMETELHTNVDGAVKGVYIAKGDRVTPGEVLIEIACPQTQAGQPIGCPASPTQ